MFIRMYGMYISSQKFDSFRISVLRNIRKIRKKSVNVWEANCFFEFRKKWVYSLYTRISLTLFWSHRLHTYLCFLNAFVLQIVEFSTVCIKTVTKPVVSALNKVSSCYFPKPSFIIRNCASLHRQREIYF